MSEIFYWWIGFGILLLIVEMVTTTFFALALWLGCFAVAIYVWYTGDASVTMTQGVIFVLSSGALAFFFTKWFKSMPSEGIKQGMEVYIGKTAKVAQSASRWTIVLDGVEYEAEMENDTQGKPNGTFVRVTAFVDGKFMVQNL